MARCNNRCQTPARAPSKGGHCARPGLRVPRAPMRPPPFTAPNLSTLAPRGRTEKMLAVLSHLPGHAGYIAFRKLKRRIGKRGEQVFRDCVAQLRPGHIAIDLGANVGSITEEMAATGATVHAFEPDPETFLHLSARFASHENVILHNAAVGGRDDTVTLYRPASWQDEDLRRSASKAISVSEMAAQRGFTPSGDVDLIDFARFIKTLDADVQLIKMDIEGAEWEVLEALETRAPGSYQAMFVETHERIDPTKRPLVRRKQAEFAARQSPYINLYWG